MPLHSKRPRSISFSHESWLTKLPSLQEVPLSLGLPVECTNSFAPASFPAASLSVSLAGGFPPTSLPETETMSLLCPAAEGKASHLVEAEQRGYSSSVAVGIPIQNATVAGAEIGGSSVSHTLPSCCE